MFISSSVMIQTEEIIELLVKITGFAFLLELPLIAGNYFMRFVKSHFEHISDDPSFMTFKIKKVDLKATDIYINVFW